MDLSVSLHSPNMRALVTGGTGRIGKPISERLQAEGWSVLAAGRADGDLAASEPGRALVGRAVDELGGLDLLVNAAAAGFAPRSVEEVTEADWDAAFGATAKGSFFVTQAAAPHLRASRGVVVMIEDVAAYQPWPSFAAHCAAKAAQAMLTRVLARALAPVAAGRSPDRGERLLDGVLGPLPVAKPPQGEREHRPRVTLVEELERPRVALPDKGDQLPVTHRFGSHRLDGGESARARQAGTE